MDMQSVLKRDESGSAGPRILVIDDEENICELITLYFDKAVYVVMCT